MNNEETFISRDNSLSHAELVNLQNDNYSNSFKSFSNTSINEDNVTNYKSLKLKIDKINNKTKQIFPTNKGGKYISLYEDFKRIKNKQDTKVSQIEKARQSQRSPSITNLAKSIKRDPSNFQERLYPYHKISQSGKSQSYKAYGLNFDENIQKRSHLFKVLDENDIYDIYGNKIDHDNIYRKSPRKYKGQAEFGFSPSINSKSLLMAKKLGNSFDRLTVKKPPKNKSPAKSMYFTGNSKSKSKINSNNSMNNSHVNNINSQTISLYDRGINSLKNKLIKNEIRNKELNDMSMEFPFQPNILPSSRDFIDNNMNNTKREVYRSSNNSNSNLNSSPGVRANVYKRNVSWKDHVMNKISKSREKKQLSENENLSFTPSIYNQRIPTDEKTIKRNLSGIYDYVKRRRSSIQKYLTNKESNPGEKSYMVKTTKPVNVFFETDKRIDRRKNNNNFGVQMKNVQSFRDLTKSNSFYMNEYNNDMRSYMN
mmetsp:Transcript_17423/g.18093  ORF Transcript_17423/g.18093 Transcript_17423/m.18093 type:complete len:482 (-) Transcript_17423:73-1518(-)